MHVGRLSLAGFGWEPERRASRSRRPRTRQFLAALALGCRPPSTAPPPTDGPPGDTGSPRYVPGDAFELSPGNEAGQDEDPAILVTATGELACAWYSNRNGTREDGSVDKQIFLVQSGDGVDWSAPVQVSAGVDAAFAPSLAQLSDGSLVAAWWREILLPAGCDPAVDCTGTDNRIAWATSADGASWQAQGDATSGPGDWLPSLVVSPDGRVLLYFAAVARGADGSVDLGQAGTLRLYVAERGADGFGAPVRLTGLAEDGFADSYPAVAVDAGGTLRLAWSRYAAGGSVDPSAIISESSADTWVATSTDGVAFSGARSIGTPGDLDVFPWVYLDSAGAWRVAWETASAGGAGREVEALFDGGVASDRPEIEGYTWRILATPSPGVEVGAWVGGSEPTQKIEGRLFVP